MKSTIWFQRLNFEVNITNLCFVPPLTSSSFEAGSHVFRVDLKLTMQPSRLSWLYRGWRTWSLSTYRIFTALPKGTSIQRWPMPLWSWFSTVAAFSLISLKTSCIYHQSDTSPFSKQTFKYIQRATSIIHSSEIQCKEILITEVMSKAAVLNLMVILLFCNRLPCRLTEQVLLPEVLRSWG